MTGDTKTRKGSTRRRTAALCCAVLASSGAVWLGVNAASGSSFAPVANPGTHASPTTGPSGDDGPPLAYSRSTSAHGTFPNAGFEYGPPSRPQPPISAEGARRTAYQREQSRLQGAQTSHAILAHMSQPGIGIDADVWFVTFTGACVPEMSADGRCADVPLTDVIDATTGEWLNTFVGGDDTASDM